jgi:hypothetical protein
MAKQMYIKAKLERTEKLSVSSLLAQVRAMDTPEVIMSSTFFTRRCSSVLEEGAKLLHASPAKSSLVVVSQTSADGLDRGVA